MILGRSSQVVGRLIAMAVWLVVHVPIAVAQDVVDSALAEPRWGDREPRWIGMYGSQIADLVPEDYRPISIDELSQAIIVDDTKVSVIAEQPVERCRVFAKIEDVGDDQQAEGLPLRDRFATSAVIRSLMTKLTLPESDIESEVDAVSQYYPLGPINLSVDASENPGVIIGPRGNAYVTGQSGADVAIDWSLRSFLSEDARAWDVRLPDATVTDFYLSVSEDQSIEVVNGSAQRLSSDTVDSFSEIETRERSGGRLWYRIESDPMKPIRLMVRPIDPKPLNMTVVRGCRISARYLGDQLKWSARVTLDRQYRLPNIRWMNGEVTSVQQDGRDVTATITGGLLTDGGVSSSLSTTTVLTYEGITRIDPNAEGSLIPLPRPIFEADQFFVPPQIWQLRLDVGGSGLVSALSLPNGWKVRTAKVLMNAPVKATGQTELNLPNKASQTVTRWSGSGPSPQGSDPWGISFDRFGSLVFANHQVRFEMDETSIQARGKFIIQVPAGSVRPVTLEVQDGFQFDFVGVGNARRNITAQLGQGRSRTITVWPGVEEITTDRANRSRLVIYANARARRGVIASQRGVANPGIANGRGNKSKLAADENLANEQPSATAQKDLADLKDVAPKSRNLSNSRSATKPSGDGTPDASLPWEGKPKPKGPARLSTPKQPVGELWLMRVTDCPGKLLATIIPPTNLSWTAKAAIEPSRIEFADLDAEQRRFFAPLPGDAIVFGGEIDSTPAIHMENPDIDLSVSLRTTLQSLDDRIEQTVEVKTEGTSGTISSMRIRLAGGGNDQDQTSQFDWSIRMQPGVPEIAIPDSDVTKQWIEASNVWEVQIALPAKHSNQSWLIGRRQRAIAGDGGTGDGHTGDGGVWVGLPNVPDAVSQIAEVWIDSSLQLRRRTESLLGVPALASASILETNEIALPKELARFRYEGDDQPWIEVTPRRFVPPSVLVIQQRLRSVASVGGTDTLRLSCLVRTDADLPLSFPSGLKLTRALIDGVAVNPRWTPEMGVVIPTRSKSSRVQSDRRINVGSPDRWVKLEVDWVSATLNDRWCRRYEFPRIWVDELVVDAREEIATAPGTIALPLIQFPWQTKQRTSVLLVPTGLVYGLGWLAALVLLSLTRIAGPRGTSIAASGIALAILAGVLWPTAAPALAAMVAVPLVLAALQGTTADWLSRDREVAEERTEDRTSESDERLKDLVGNADENSGSNAEDSHVAATGSWTQAFAPRDRGVAGDLTRSIETPMVSHQGNVNEPMIDDRGDDSRGEFSSSSIVPLWLAVCCTLASSALIPEMAMKSLFAQDRAPADSESVDSSIDVLVPLKEDGSVFGNKIYIPNSFYNELLFKRPGPKVEDALIEKANYRLRLRSTSTLENDPTGSFQGVAEPQMEAERSPPRSGLTQNDLDRSSTLARAAAIVETLRSDDCVAFQVDLVLRPLGQAGRLRLPYQADEVDDVRVMKNSPDDNVEPGGFPPRFGRDELGWLWIETPSDWQDASNREIALRLSLRCELDWNSPWVTVKANVPSLAMANLVVQTERQVHSVMLQTPRSSQLVSCDSPSTTDPFAFESSLLTLGTISQLDVRFRFDEAASAVLPWNEPSQWQTRYWVYSQPDQTVIECELEPLGELPPEVVVTMQTTREGARLLGEGWRLVESEDSDSTTLQFVSIGAPNVPIRLGWTIPTQFAVLEARSTGQPLADSTNLDRDGFADESQTTEGFVPPQGLPSSEPEAPKLTVNLPQVRIGAGSPDASARQTTASLINLPWIAWTFSKDLQPDWTVSNSVETLAIDQFYASWKGYLRSIDRATVGFVPELTLRRIAPSRPQWLTRHEINIEPTQQKIDLLVELKPSSAARESDLGEFSKYALRLPPRAHLLDWRYATMGGPTISPSWADDGVEGQGGIANATSVPPSIVNAPDNATRDSIGQGLRQLSGQDSVPWDVVRRPTPDGDQTTLYFDGPASGFVIEVEATLPHSGSESGNRNSLTTGKPIGLGWIELDQVSQTPSSTNPSELEQVHDLQITRSLDTNFKWLEQVDAEKITDEFEDASALLTSGRILVDRFTTSQSLEDTFGKARFRVRKLNPVLDVDSRITLRWEEGRWTAQTDFEVSSKYCPDFIDIALPSRWCDSLQVDPLCVSSRQPTLDPALQVIRVELRAASPEAELVRNFRLISRLAVSEIARVSVPEIRVLDSRRHRIDVVVPTRLTNEQVRWRSNFAGPIEKPRWSVASPMRLPDDSALSVYAVTAPGWSIDLETLPQTNRRASCLHADHRVLVRPHDSRALMVSRFDILPGDQSSVRLSLGSGTELLGVWAATRPADLRRVNDPRGDDDESDVKKMERSEDFASYAGSSAESQWDVPLPLSRLSQTIEVLSSVELSGLASSLTSQTTSQTTSQAMGQVVLPQLVGVSEMGRPCTMSWCEPTSGAPRSWPRVDRWMKSPISTSMRSQVLASSVIRAIAASSDALADRRDEEVAVWMRPWIRQYRVLSRSVGRVVGQDLTPENESIDGVFASNPDALDESNLNDSNVLKWQEMDQYILNQEVRYFAADPDAFADDQVRASVHTIDTQAEGSWSDFLSLSMPPGYVERWAFQWDQPTVSMAALASSKAFMPDQTRQQVLRACVFLAVAFFILVPIVFPRETNRSSPGQRLMSHPAVWLFSMGLVGVVLMPIPMALGLMFAAVVLGGLNPGYPSLSHWWRTRSA